jgi:hypothetical protein
LFGQLTEGGRSPTGVSRPNNAPRERVAATRRLMTAKSFVVRKPANGASYRILDPLGFAAGKANEFLEHLEVRGRSPYTLHSHALGLADFLGWLH